MTVKVRLGIGTIGEVSIATIAAADVVCSSVIATTWINVLAVIVTVLIIPRA